MKKEQFLPVYGIISGTFHMAVYTILTIPYLSLFLEETSIERKYCNNWCTGTSVHTNLNVNGQFGNLWITGLLR